jgi:nucleoid-associated protein YgaU
MASGDDTGVNVKAIIAVLLGLSVAGGLAVVMTRDASVPQDVAAVSDDAPATEEAPLSEAEAEDGAPAEAVDDSAPEAPDSAPEAPRFDQIRVAPDGATVIAGQAPPGFALSLQLDGEEVATTRAGATGEFAAILSLDPSEQPRILSLVATDADGTEVPGGETAIIAPFGVLTAEAEDTGETPEVAEADATDPAPEASAQSTEIAAAGTDPVNPPATDDTPTEQESAGVAEATDDTAPADAELATTVATADAPAEGAESAVDATLVPPEEISGATPTETAPDAEAETETASAEAETVATEAPAIVVASPEGVRVVQGGDGVPQAQTEVQIDAISYTTQGDVALSGRGPADRQVQILLNNRVIQLGEIGPGGEWSLELPDVDPGTYTLTVAQLSPDGVIETRVDTPFLREDPARVAASPMRVQDGVSVITVQPGFTLWGIAEANFGDGIAYVQIFQENRENIRDPDLIFPGQIFQLPDLPRDDAAP